MKSTMKSTLFKRRRGLGLRGGEPRERGAAGGHRAAG